ncbi:hypothetical protein [Evansella cellulosilytica]|uniref:CvpA family protein n=1 Tax=Evansella cellulosilytica (strain ATCC 21833 / DSM 2522 / FERM P-1141 / JCM 9156 / N-4) TaxID=649639 RepID=E6U042_EVAC2|nr:hypothetical protein [Evansella cellulosilytica]ADU29046.1 hypothetical protein Bcell_0765 [Evansella cellulosilytica DSM 2522]
MLQILLISALLALLFLPLQIQWWKMPFFRKWILSRYVSGFIFSFFIFYFGLLDQSLSAIITTYLPIVGIALIADNSLVYSFKKTFRKKAALVGVGSGAAILLGFSLFWIFQPLFLADAKFEIAGGVEVSSEDLSPVSEENIPVVPRSFARYRSDVLMGQLDNPAFYNLGETRIQRIDGTLYWVTPIEYDGFFRWWRSDYAPGYITVNAENPQAEPTLVQTEMNYVPSAYFHENLERHVRLAFPDVLMLDTTFEVDSEGNPFYIVSYGHYTEFRRVADVDGIIIVDPRTGDMEQFEKENAPEWVNRIYPPHIAEERNEWFGVYKQGLINRYFGREGLTEPTDWGSDDSVVGVVDRDLQQSWLTDHMRLRGDSETSNSMVGFTMFDARTGELRYFRDASGMMNGRTAMNLAERTFRRDDYVAGTPSLYNIYSQYTWVVPLMDRDNVLRQIMLVNASSESVYGYGSTKREAFSSYQLALSSRVDDDVIPGEITDLVEVTATVERVYKWDREDNVTVRLLIEGYDRIFTVNASAHPRAVFIEAGDEITIHFMDTGEEIQSIEELEF